MKGEDEAVQLGGRLDSPPEFSWPTGQSANSRKDYSLAKPVLAEWLESQLHQLGVDALKYILGSPELVSSALGVLVPESGAVPGNNLIDLIASLVLGLAFLA